MTKKQLLRHYKTDSAIARLFGLHRQAVHQWEDDAAIPAKHLLRLRYELRPDLFKKAQRRIAT